MPLRKDPPAPDGLPDASHVPPPHLTPTHGFQDPPKVYPPVPAEKRKPIRVLSLFDGIATGGWGSPGLAPTGTLPGVCLGPVWGVEGSGVSSLPAPHNCLASGWGGPTPIGVSAVGGQTCAACGTPSGVFPWAVCTVSSALGPGGSTLVGDRAEGWHGDGGAAGVGWGGGGPLSSCHPPQPRSPQACWC